MLKINVALIGLISFFSSCSFACDMSNVVDIYEQFKLLDYYNNNLAQKNLSFEGVQIVKKNLENIQNFSKTCIETQDAGIKKLEDIHQGMAKIANNQIIQQRLLQYDNELCVHQNRKVLCQSLGFAAEKVVIASQKEIETYRRSLKKPNIAESINLFKLGNLNFANVVTIQEFLNLDLLSPSQLNQLAKLFALGIVLGILGFFGLNIVYKKIDNYVANRVVYMMRYFMLFFIPIVLILHNLSLYFNTYAQKPLLVMMLLFAQLMIKSLLFLRLFYWLARPNRSPILLKQFMFWMSISTIVLIFQYFTYLFYHGFFISYLAANFMSQISIFLFMLIFFGFGRATIKSGIKLFYADLNKASKLKYQIGLTVVLGIVCLFEIYFAFIGYTEFAYNFVTIFIVLSIYVFLFKKLLDLLKNTKSLLHNPTSNLSKQINHLCGKKYNEVFLNFYLVFYVISICCALLLLKSVLIGWGLPIILVSYVEQVIFYGFYFGDYLVKPFFLIQVGFIVLIINTIGQLVSIYHTSQVNLEDDKKFTIRFLIQGVFYLISLIVALKMFGVQQAQLSFIIGAFSVGIGIALRGVIVDFLAGIYLVFQKPVYIGDYIEINGAEGQVKRISLLTTMLVCSNNTVVFIPNEEFLRRNVFNKTYVRKKIPCSMVFSIKNFNDFDMARSVILEVLAKYPDIYFNEDYHPQILFDQLKDSKNPIYTIKVIFYLQRILQKDGILASIQLETLKRFQERKVAENSPKFRK